MVASPASPPPTSTSLTISFTVCQRDSRGRLRKVATPLVSSGNAPTLPSSSSTTNIAAAAATTTATTITATALASATMSPRTPPSPSTLASSSSGGGSGRGRGNGVDASPRVPYGRPSQKRPSSSSSSSSAVLPFPSRSSHVTSRVSTASRNGRRDTTTTIISTTTTNSSNNSHNNNGRSPPRLSQESFTCSPSPGRSRPSVSSSVGCPALLLDLPLELFAEVVRRLPLSDVGALAQTCRRSAFLVASEAPYLARTLYLSRWTQPRMDSEDTERSTSGPTTSSSLDGEDLTSKLGCSTDDHDDHDHDHHHHDDRLYWQTLIASRRRLPGQARKLEGLAIASMVGRHTKKDSSGGEALPALLASVAAVITDLYPSTTSRKSLTSTVVRFNTAPKRGRTRSPASTFSGSSGNSSSASVGASTGLSTSAATTLSGSTVAHLSAGMAAARDTFRTALVTAQVGMSPTQVLAKSVAALSACFPSSIVLLGLGSEDKAEREGVSTRLKAGWKAAGVSGNLVALPTKTPSLITTITTTTTTTSTSTTTTTTGAASNNSACGGASPTHQTTKDKKTAKKANEKKNERKDKSKSKSEKRTTTTSVTSSSTTTAKSNNNSKEVVGVRSRSVASRRRCRSHGEDVVDDEAGGEDSESSNTSSSSSSSNNNNNCGGTTTVVTRKVEKVSLRNGQNAEAQCPLRSAGFPSAITSRVSSPLQHFVVSNGSTVFTHGGMEVALIGLQDGVRRVWIVLDGSGGHTSTLRTASVAHYASDMKEVAYLEGCLLPPLVVGNECMRAASSVSRSSGESDESGWGSETEEEEEEEEEEEGKR